MAILGADFPGLRIRPEVAEGEAVSAGQVLFRDRRRPDIAFVAPVDGQVASIRYGAKRLFAGLVLDCSPSDPAASQSDAPPDAHSRDAVLALLTKNGFWPSFIMRPFGGMPDPQSKPDAIFVTATPANKDAPDPRAVLVGQLDAFGRALEALAILSDGQVFLCQPKGSDLMPVVPAKVTVAKFPEKPGFGLPGTHVHRLHPVGAGRSVWTIGYQDAVSIGHFLATGQLDFSRVVAVSGSAGGAAKTVRLPLGAKLYDAMQACFPHREGGSPRGGSRLVSGNQERGREAAFLGRYHEEVTRLPVARRSRSIHPEPIIAHAGLDHGLAMSLLAVPLMRALSMGDVETAKRLGCLELLEDDVAALSARCTSGTDYARCLRQALDALKEAA